MKLQSFMNIVDHTILRLKFERKLTSTTDRYEFLRIIIKNRELWKSLCFSVASLQNIVLIL